MKGDENLFIAPFSDYFMMISDLQFKILFFYTKRDGNIKKIFIIKWIPMSLLLSMHKAVLRGKRFSSFHVKREKFERWKLFARGQWRKIAGLLKLCLFQLEEKIFPLSENNFNHAMTFHFFIKKFKNFHKSFIVRKKN